MRQLRAWFLRLTSLFNKRRRDRDLAAEIDSHLQMHMADNLDRGMTPAEARRQALIKLGGVEQAKENYRARRGLPMLETLVQDIRYGLRVLRKSPGFTAVAVLTLALGIGANTAIFSLVDWLVLRPLPVERPSQVAFLETSFKSGGTGTQFSYPDFEKIQQQTADIFAGTSALKMFQMDGLSVDGKSQPMWSNFVAGNFFSLLGIKPALGRLILPSEGKFAGADPVLVISYSYWKSRFDGDPSIIGKKASVNGRPMTIVGVTAAGFRGLAALFDAQGYMPLGMAATLQDAPPDFLTNPKGTGLELIARLKPGVSFEQAQPVLQVVAQRLSEQEQYHGGMTVHALPLGPSSLVTGPAVASRIESGELVVLDSRRRRARSGVHEHCQSVPRSRGRAPAGSRHARSPGSHARPLDSPVAHGKPSAGRARLRRRNYSGDCREPLVRLHLPAYLNPDPSGFPV